MERDAPPPVPPRLEDVVPPPEPAAVYSVAAAGLGLIGVAALLGLAVTLIGDRAPWPLATARLWLVGLGAVVTGYAVSRRPGLPGVWLLAAVTAGLAVVGVPATWDSFRLLFAVLAVVAAAGAGVVALPPRWRVRVASVLVLLHFGGIFMATTSPETQGSSPWLTHQLFTRVYYPYLQFIYQRNAYHFYSPEPGPASLLAFMVKTHTGERIDRNGITVPTYDREWYVIPKRPDDVKDPLAVSYFRRLSITEQTAGAVPGGYGHVLFEADEARRRRQLARYYDEAAQEERAIPFHPFEQALAQYRVPFPNTLRYTLPSYAKHVIHERTNGGDERAPRTTVMIYKLVHSTVAAHELARKRDPVAPYAPSTFRTFFLGEYNSSGELVNPRDAMLYWQMPIYPKESAATGVTGPPDPDEYVDYLSLHAGQKFDWRSLR